VSWISCPSLSPSPILPFASLGFPSSHLKDWPSSSFSLSVPLWPQKICVLFGGSPRSPGVSPIPLSLSTLQSLFPLNLPRWVPSQGFIHSWLVLASPPAAPLATRCLLLSGPVHFLVVCFGKEIEAPGESWSCLCLSHCADLVRCPQEVLNRDQQGKEVLDYKGWALAFPLPFLVLLGKLPDLDPFPLWACFSCIG
jgi:hypothetical protein